MKPLLINRGSPPHFCIFNFEFCILFASVTESFGRQRQSHASRLNGAFSLLSALRHVSPARKSIVARTILAVMLVLVLLAGVVPFSSLASSHECGMACCVGKPSHMAGSCSTHLGNEEQEAEPPAEADEEQSAHARHMRHPASTPAATANSSSGHHGAGLHSSAHRSTSKKAPVRKASVASQAMIRTPCSPDCAAAASCYSQVRRPRDPSQVALSARPRPPTLCFQVAYLSKPLPESAERRRLSRPRAPPFHLVSLSA